MGTFDAIKGAGAAINATSIVKGSGTTRTFEKKNIDVRFGSGDTENFTNPTFTAASSKSYSAKGNPFSAEYTDAIADGLRNSSDRKAFMLKLLSC